MKSLMFVVSAVALIVITGCGGGGGKFDPTPGWPNGRVISDVPLPNNTTDYAKIDKVHFAVSNYKLFRSVNEGSSWEELPADSTRSGITAISTDGGKLYCAYGYGIISSEDKGDSFSGEYGNLYDRTRDIDVRNGYGWMVVENWGSDSGPHRRTPTDPEWKLCRGDIPWSSMSLWYVLADTVDPANRAYVSGVEGRFMTTDAGQHWTHY